MSKCKNPEEIYFYATRSTELGWTRDVLLNYIKADAFSTREEQPKLHNFKETLPECLQEQAEEMLKSRYNLEFLGITKPILELELERRLVDKIKTFLLEMERASALSETSTAWYWRIRSILWICSFSTAVPGP